MTCVATQNRSYVWVASGLFGGLVIFLLHMTGAFSGGVAWLKFVVFGYLLVGLAAAIASFVTSKATVIQIDEAGIHDRRLNDSIIDWEDVLSVHRSPLWEKTASNEWTFHFRDGWRPISLTVRNPDKYLSKIQTAARRFLLPRLPSWKIDPDTAHLHLDFVGLTPVSAQAYECIQHHLNRRGAKTGQLAGKAG